MFTLKKLQNGITLITVPVKGTMATTVLAMFPVGSRYETKKVSGASHFLEHMLFKGTEKRPTHLDISRALEQYGAEFNAYTNKDYTGYYVKINGQEQEVAFDLLSDMIYHSVLENAEVEKEKGAVVEELRMYKDNPMAAVDELFDTLIFGNTPMGWEIGGTPETVRGMNRQDLLDYYHMHYSPKNMVLVVAGNITAKTKKFIEYFSTKKAPGIAKGPAFYKKEFQKVSWPKAPTLEDRIAVDKRSVDQTQIVLGYPSIACTDKDRFVQGLMMTILGAGMSSRLFVEVREKRGLAYTVRAGSVSYRDAGVGYIQAGLDSARFGEAVAVIKAEVARMANEPVSALELREAKTSIAGGMALSLENSRTQAEWYARQFLFNTKVETPEQSIARLEKVTAKQIQAFAKKIFKDSEMRLAVVGPLERAAVVEAVKKA